MAKQVDVIRKFVDVLSKTSKTGTDAVDEALKSVGAGNYTAFLAKFKSDQSGLSKQDFLEQICGVRLKNKDTGAITGSDAGGSTTKTDESIVPEKAAAKELTAAEYNSFTKNGLTVNIEYDTSTDGGANFNYDSENYLAKQKLVVRALYNWWIPESLALINESLGINFTDGRANINEIDIEFTDDFSPDYAKTNAALSLDFDYDLGYASDVTLKINSALLYKMTSSDKNGTLDGNKYVQNTLGILANQILFGYLDRLFLNALSEITLKANVPYMENLPDEILRGLYEIVGGYDLNTENYYYYTDKMYYNNYQGAYYGYTLLRYLAKNYAVETLPAGLSYNSDKTVLTASTAFTGDTIDLSEFESSVKTVNASKLTKAVSIIGNALNNSIVGGSGADTIDGAAGNDSLTGGAGNDLFVYSAGRDVITDYAAGDRISVGAAVSKSSVSGSDVVFTIGDGSLTVKNGKGKTLSMIDSSGNAYTTVLGGSTTSTLLTVTNSTKSPVTIGSAVKNVDASKRTSAVKITGNTLANSIVGGSGNDTLDGGAGNDSLTGGAGNDSILGGEGADKLYGGAGNDVLSGGAGNDSLWGGAGNDTFTGGAGNDYFIYSGGKDIITDYATGDKISLGAAVSKASISGSNVIFTIGSGSLTVKNGKGKTLSMIDSKGKAYSTVVGGSSGSTTPSSSTTLTVTNSTKSPVKLASGVKVADASKRTTAVKITGNELANSIIGGKGNDTLDGGKGNDSLWGNAGNDVFLYSDGEGKDVIYGFANDDMLLITGAFSGSYNKSKKEIAFKVGSTASAITLKNYTATTFNINGYDYGISGTNLVKK